jgi:hypothetical protein
MTIASYSPMVSASSGTRTVGVSTSPAGAAIIVPVTVKSDTVTPTVTDNSGSNVYTMVPEVAGGEVGDGITGMFFYCANAAPTTQVTASAGVSVAIHAGVLVLTDMPTSGLIDVAQGGIGPTGQSWPPVTVDPADPANMVIGIAVLPLTSRPLELNDVTYTALAGVKANSLSTDIAYKENAGDEPTGPAWKILTGSGASDTYMPMLTLSLNTGAPPEPESLTLASATGLTTVVGAATLIEAVSDSDPDSYGETGDDLAGPPFRGVMPPIIPPEADFQTTVDLSVDIGSAVATVALSNDGTTWIDATSGPVAVTTTDTPQVFTWSAASITSLTNWDAMELRVSFGTS